MAKKVELIVPKMGESIQEATILNWLKNEGEEIESDEPVVEVATDKVDSDIPSPVSGKIVQTLYQKDDVVKVGQPIAVIETEEEVGEDVPLAENGESKEETKTKEPAGKEEEPATAGEKEEVPVGAERTPAPSQEAAPSRQGQRFYSPLVRNIASTESIGMEELERVPGSGKNGRVTKKDILFYVERRKEEGAPVTEKETGERRKEAAPKEETRESIPAGGAAPEGIKQPEVPVYPGDEVVEMDRMRKMISEHMVRSKHTSPHVTSMVEVDVTPIVNWRNRVKDKFYEREGEKLTFTPIFIEAIIKVIKEMPMVNVSVAGDKIIKRKKINIGMATALPSGNLIVPVIHEADNLNLIGLAKKVNDLAHRARDKKLDPEEVQGGTFSITNVGTFGNVMGTPVINQPQVAILATGAIQKKPAVIETENGDMIGVRHKMFLSMSYDHRVVDGAIGGSFIRKVADYLEAFNTKREF